MFPERLRKLRKEAGLTQEQLGDLLGLDDSTISSYERDKSRPNHDVLKRLADLLHVSVDYLLGHTDVRAKTRLQRLREEAGLSQLQLAERSGVPLSVISEYESGGPEPAGHFMVQLADALGVSTAYLRNKTDDPERNDRLPLEWEQTAKKIRSRGFTHEDLLAAFDLLERARERGKGQSDP